MKWKTATLSQLYCIAYNDPMATTVDRHQAQNELVRRAVKAKKYGRKQYREKVVG